VAGKGRRTRYAARRAIPGVDTPVPVFELRPAGEDPRRLGDLHPVAPGGFVLVPAGGGESAFHPDLPWFLHDLRPSGFLGRLVPRRYPELGLPPDIRLWSGDHVLAYATRHGWDLPGAFILGEGAYQAWAAQTEAPSNAVDEEERAAVYPRVAANVMGFGAAGSSAAGEQPKFLATRRSGTGLVPVLVKFSPPVDSAAGMRVADLLVAEHLALETLRAEEVEAPPSTVLTAAGRRFLEVERFDRGGTLHRLGLVSLQALDAAFEGSDQSSWSSSVGRLAAHGLVPLEDLEKVRWLETFGRLIGNTDQHFGNLSFQLDGTRVTRLAPAYDVLPAHYSPRAGEVVDSPWPLPTLGPSLARVAAAAVDAAVAFWGLVAMDERVSPAFRMVAARDRERVAGLRAMISRLPRT
jgi:hypothetical protein